MIIGGLQKTTLIDFPGRVACTLFVIGCNFRCPFCHNRDLVSLELFKKAKLQSISEDYFFEFLEKRKKILDGVCISGGEPTIHEDLPQLCRQIKKLGLEVKLDSNGSNFQLLKRLIDSKLIDSVAMDVKNSFDKYSQAIGVKGFEKTIKKSIKLILKSGLEYEFRTTVAPGLHDKETMVKLAKDIKKTAQPLAISHQSLNYVLQRFRPQNCLDPKYLKIKPYSSLEMKSILQSVQEILPKTKLRVNN